MALRSRLEHVSSGLIEGWAWDTDEPDTPLSVIVSIDDAVVGRCLANQYREDLAKAAIGDGRHAFVFKPASSLAPLVRHVVAVRREGDGAHLSNSPQVLEAASAFNQETRSAIIQILTAAGDDDDLRARLAFVLDVAGQLRQIQADRTSDAPGRAARHRRRPSDFDGARTASSDDADRPRALVIDDRMPLRDHDAGSNAILSHMRALQRIGYDVTFAPANLRGDGEYLASQGFRCCLHPWYTSIEEVLTRQHNAYALVYLHRVTTAGRYAMLVRDNQPKARLVYSVADLYHLRLDRQAAVEGRSELTGLSEWMRVQELTSAWLADAVITHSTVEAALLRRHMRPEKVHVVPWSLAPRATAVPFGERSGLAFIGGYGHRPNVDAALWLVDAIMPEVEAQYGPMPCLLVGSNMPDVLQRLRRHDVDPVGYVPDLSHVFDRVRLTVAPMVFGAGIKGKVLDSLAAGVPCVCTPTAAEGLDLPDVLARLIAEAPAELARSIVALHNDASLNQACSDAGLDYIRTMASETRVDDLMRVVVGHVDKRRPESAAPQKAMSPSPASLVR